MDGQQHPIVDNRTVETHLLDLLELLDRGMLPEITKAEILSLGEPHPVDDFMRQCLFLGWYILTNIAPGSAPRI